MNHDSTIQVGVVGAGDVADRHVEGLLRAGHVAIAAVAEPDNERRVRFAERFGIASVFEDYHHLCDSPRIDVLLILTPHCMHASMVTEALKAGKHVICEKPLAPTVRECDLLIENARSLGRELFVTHALREDYFYRAAAAALEAGELGRPLVASFRWFTDETPRLEAPGHWKGTTDRSGGGVLIDGGPHVADLANAFFGRAIRCDAFGGKLVTEREEVAEDTAVFQTEYEGGAMASFVLTFTGGAAWGGPGGFAAGVTIDLFGTEGHAEGGFLLRNGAWKRWFVRQRSGFADREESTEDLPPEGDIDVQIVRALRGEAPPPVTCIEARNAIAVVEAAYSALRTGQTVDVDWRES